MHEGKTIPPGQFTATKEQVVMDVKHLYKSFGSNNVLSDFNFTLYRGENTVILGKSGSGKSVFIKCVIGLMEADKGSVMVLGESVPDLGQNELDRLRARVGFLFQSNALYDSMTVRENLEFPLRRAWLKSGNLDADKLVREVLGNVGLEHTIDMMPSELSGGMRKRIALARTLILKPDIILYDEPTTGLDPITSREISELMRKIGEKYNTSSVIISHDMNCIKLVADRIVILYDGIAYAMGTYNELKESSDPLVRQFFE